MKDKLTRLTQQQHKLINLAQTNDSAALFSIMLQ